MTHLKHKWALITGSSRGIGQQIALGLAAQGCNIILHGRDSASVQKTRALLAGFEIEIAEACGPLDSPESVAAIIAAVNAGPGRVDILYNNAAIMTPGRTMWDIPHSDWLQTFQVNLYAVVQLCNAFAPAMAARGFGRIINITSGIKDQPDLTVYSVSKGAIDKYTQDLAAQMRGTNVLVSHVDPGWLRTDLGGPNAEHAVETVLPGALMPA
ncbi:MAG TPA: SDR family oxidoreductase, partial [Cellvibrionaceae bacterium]|nr:SDR family oxidoreductase [Cellvibrionaceae bacterium]